MDYSSTLSYLKDLLGTSQAQNASQYSSGLDFLKQQLGQQGSEYQSALDLQRQIADWQNQLGLGRLGLDTQTAGWQNELANKQLGETGREFDVSTALQKVIADWQNQLANKEFGLKQQEYNYSISPQARYASEFAALSPQLYADAKAKQDAALNRIGMSQWQSRYPQYANQAVSSIFPMTTPTGNWGTVRQWTSPIAK